MVVTRYTKSPSRAFSATTGSASCDFVEVSLAVLAITESARAAEESAAVAGFFPHAAMMLASSSMAGVTRRCADAAARRAMETVMGHFIRSNALESTRRWGNEGESR